MKIQSLSILLAHVDYHGCLVIERLVCELGAKDWLSQSRIQLQNQLYRIEIHVCSYYMFIMTTQIVGEVNCTVLAFMGFSWPRELDFGSLCLHTLDLLHKRFCGPQAPQLYHVPFLWGMITPCRLLANSAMQGYISR